MSITPFLSGLPVAVPTDLGTLPDGSDTSGRSGDPGDPGAAFGEALAAALLVAPPPVAAPATPVDLGLAPVESRVAPVESWVPPVESGPAPIASPQSPVESLVSSLEPAAPSAGPTPAGTAGAEPASTTSPAPGQIDHQAAVRRTGDVTVASSPAQPGSAIPDNATHDSTGETHESTGETHDSTGVSGKSTVAIATPTPPTPPPTTTTTTVERAVVQQVFPEVTRFVATTSTDRPGTHRITLTLQPEQLGEVRVTLVVKDGSVQVRLAGSAGDAAGDAAVHRALSSGAPELQRLLERAGAAEARVLVRDPAAPGSTSGGANTGAADQQGRSGQADQSGDGWTSGDSRHPGAREHRPAAPAYRIPTGTDGAGPTPGTTPLTARSTGLLDRTI